MLGGLFNTSCGLSLLHKKTWSLRRNNCYKVSYNFNKLFALFIARKGKRKLGRGGVRSGILLIAVLQAAEYFWTALDSMEWLLLQRESDNLRNGVLSFKWYSEIHSYIMEL